MDLFKRKEIFKVKSVPLDPQSIKVGEDASGFVSRGMAYYARQKYELAETDLQQAIILNPGDIEAHYCLGMVLKAQYKMDEAVKNFQQVVNLLLRSSSFPRAKAGMLRRLALGHINKLTQGDWNLEKEIWHRIQ
jgi:tetratricopeptide (TPR) repeat protein